MSQVVAPPAPSRHPAPEIGIGKCEGIAQGLLRWRLVSLSAQQATQFTIVEVDQTKLN